MKKNHLFLLIIISSVVVFLFVNGCSKKTEKPTSDCKTCKAIGVDGVNQKQVCSEAEETEFRNENAGKEISCQ